MKYFTIDEFTKSDTADVLGINNTPTQWQKDHIKELVENLLDPLREDWGKYCKQHGLGTAAIYITSGVRSESLNKAIGGSKTSAHYTGYAADLVPCNKQLAHFKKFCIDWLFDKDFDQFISEDEEWNNRVPRWIHIGYKNIAGKQRRQFMYMVNDKYYTLSEQLNDNYL